MRRIGIRDEFQPNWTERNNWVPRLGRAYRPFGNNTVIRTFYIGANTRQGEWGYDINRPKAASRRG